MKTGKKVLIIVTGIIAILIIISIFAVNSNSAKSNLAKMKRDFDSGKYEFVKITYEFMQKVYQDTPEFVEAQDIYKKVLQIEENKALLVEENKVLVEENKVLEKRKATMTHYLLIIGIPILIGIIICIIIAIGDNSTKKKKLNSLLSDERFRNAKIFNSAIMTPIVISENGYIGIVNKFSPKPTILHIKYINGFELLENGRNVANIYDAIIGGLLFGRAGAIIGGSATEVKIHSMTLLFKINDFNNPTVEIPLLIYSTIKGSIIYNSIQREINRLFSTLEIVEKIYKKIS